MQSNDIEIILAIIDQAFDHKSWHGTNLKGSIRGLTCAEASWRPSAGRHNIREIVIHAAYWKYIARRRLPGGKRGSFPRKGSDWFTPVESTEAAWRQDVRLLDDMHRSLRQAIAGFDPADLQKTPPGSKTSHFALLTGVAAHDLYHAGQIQLLKRLGARPRRK